METNKCYPQNEEEANTFLSMYILCSYFYIGARIIQNAVNECLITNDNSNSLSEITNLDKLQNPEIPEETDYDFIKLEEVD